MTSEEHARMQELEGLVKRYRSRIVELKLDIVALERALAEQPRYIGIIPKDKQTHIAFNVGTLGEALIMGAALGISKEMGE